MSSYFKIKLFIGIFLLFLIINKIPAQSTPYVTLNLGYQNLNGNYGSTGLSLYLVQQNDDVLTFSLNANMAYMKDSFIIIPEGEVAYTFSGKNHAPYKDVNASFFKPSLAFSPYSVTPKFGISILNLWDVFAGYSFQFSEPPRKSLKGFVIGTKFQIPLQIFQK